MLYTSKERFDTALRGIDTNPIICSCGKEMKPKHWNFSDRKEFEFAKFLRVTCECGRFLKGDISNFDFTSSRFSRKNDT